MKRVASVVTRIVFDVETHMILKQQPNVTVVSEFIAPTAMMENVITAAFITLTV